MEFHEKLQQLRKQKNLTQDQLAEALYVSRTAVSKWESGRGYPSIDSLKMIAEFYAVSIDDLLSGSELVTVAERDSAQKTRQMCNRIYGLLDCSMALFLFFPIFGQRTDTMIAQVSLLALTQTPYYLKIIYLILVLTTVIWGITTLTLQGYGGAFWIKWHNRISLSLSILNTVAFMATLQVYAAFLAFVFFIIKGSLLLKNQ